MNAGMSFPSPSLSIVIPTSVIQKKESGEKKKEKANRTQVKGKLIPN